MRERNRSDCGWHRTKNKTAPNLRSLAAKRVAVSILELAAGARKIASDSRS
jgi:hypothetical protein